MNSRNKYLIKKYFLACLLNAFVILKSNDFKNTIFKVVFIETAISNEL